MPPARRPLCLALVALSLLALPAAANAAPTITEFSAGLTANSAPADITTGPDGNLWFTESADPGRIGRITPNGVITEFTAGLSLNSQPQGITAGPDGNLWFTERALPGRIGRITPAGVITEFSLGLSLNSQPQDIVAGPDGNLWFTQAADPGRIGRITPSGVITEFTTGLTPNSQPQDIAVGPDGALWFTEKADPGRVGRITTSGAISEYGAGLTDNSGPNAIAAGPDGSLWFTTTKNTGRVAKLTTAGDFTEYTSGLSVGLPGGIASGDDGHLWFTEQADPGTIGRVMTDGTISEYSSGLTANSAPGNVTLGPDGNMWFTESADPGRIGRITTGPGVGAVSVSAISASTATLSAGVNPHAQSTAVYFQYGGSDAYGFQTASTSAGSGTTQEVVAGALSGLAPGTTYHVRAVATNGSDTTFGPDATFSTAPAPAPSTPAPAAPLKPALGKSVLVSVASGRVLVKRPGSARFVPVQGATLIPVGSLVNVRHGRVALETALPGGGTQNAAVWGAVFRVAQRSSTGMTDIFLRDRPSCRRPVAPHGASASVRRRRQAKLWTSDRGGRFRTHGKNSVATVRGTRWLTAERCDGTLTRVTKGSVVVRDLNTGRKVRVRAGASYLAKAARQAR